MDGEERVRRWESSGASQRVLPLAGNHAELIREKGRKLLRVRGVAVTKHELPGNKHSVNTGGSESREPTAQTLLSQC